MTTRTTLLTLVGSVFLSAMVSFFVGRAAARCRSGDAVGACVTEFDGGQEGRGDAPSAVISECCCRTEALGGE